MNWKGQTVPILLNGLKLADRSQNSVQTPPATEQVEAISPLAQIRNGAYRTPSFIIHGTKDDLIPWQQAQRTYETLCECGVEAELRIVEGGVHLFDTSIGFERNEEAARAVREGYEFLGRFVRGSWMVGFSRAGISDISSDTDQTNEGSTGGRQDLPSVEIETSQDRLLDL